MDQVDLFKKYFNQFLLENSKKMLEKSLILTTFDKDCYLLMQAFNLCKYENENIVFEKDDIKYRIESIFNDVIKYSYSISKPSDFFTNEHIINFSEQFNFIKEIPSNYYLKFHNYQIKLYQNYWAKIDKEKIDFFNKKILSNKNINGEIYTYFLQFFLGKEYSINKIPNGLILEKIVNDQIIFFIQVDIKFIDHEIKKYGRLPPFPIFIKGGFFIDSYKFFFNRIEHPAIDSLSFHHGLYQESASTELKWLFILCDIAAYYINMCFDFYEESLLEYIKKYS
ncbi:hypothetical protein [Acinetobacter sp. G18]|uniref:hypothetical protein n=1 Tax=Acinetobacter sp. G18 TaxID=2952152 RepID=UPI004043FF89